MAVVILLPFTIADAAQYTPLLLGSKLLEWWDATDPSTLTLTGSLVDAWVGKKNGFTLVGAGATRPTFNAHKMNGMGSVVFGGAHKLSTGVSEAFFDTDIYNALAAATIEATSGEWCRLLSYIATGDTHSWATAESAIILTREPPTSKAICSFSNSVPRSSKDLIALGIPSVMEYWRDGVNGTAAVDSVDGAPTATVGAMGATGQFNVGSDAAMANPLTGMVSSIVVTRGTLTAEERAKLQGYMAWRCLLQRNLPPAHPWKSVSPIRVAPLPVARPRITFFYGADPAAVEGLNNPTLAGMYFAANFDHVVLGQGIQDPGHPGHANAIAVVAAAVAANPNIKFYGYLHMSQDPGIPPNYSDAEIAAQIGQWITLVKVHGLFMDECEAAFQTYMSSINAALQVIHSTTTFYGQPGIAIVNGWDHSYFYSGNVVPTYNPLGLRADILPTDMTCMESQAFNDCVALYEGADDAAPGSNGYAHGHFLMSQGAAGLACRNYFQCGFVTVNLYDYGTTSLPELAAAWVACQRVAKLFGNTATGLCVKDFGATGPGANKCTAFTYDSDYDQYISANPVIAGEEAAGVTNGSVIRYAGFSYQSTFGVHVVS